MVKFGLSGHNLVDSPTRQLYDQIEEAAEIVRFAAALGTFDSLRFPIHWFSSNSVFLEPIPLLARLAPEAGQMRLLPSVLRLPLHNPVELAHQVATIDHICNGRFILGVGIGYQENELKTVGATRKQRVGRFEESLALMKELWTGEEVTFEGQYWSAHNVRMGYTCAQQPHPPIWNAASSVPAARRAARICDGLFVGNQVTWQELARLATEYRGALQEAGKASGTVGANRQISIAPTFEEADKVARAGVERAAANYNRWGMQEDTGVDVVLDPRRDPREFSIVGTPQDCVETISRFTQELGIDWIGLAFDNMPKDHSARKEYLQYVSEQVLSHFAPPENARQTAASALTADPG